MVWVRMKPDFLAVAIVLIMLISSFPISHAASQEVKSRNTLETVSGSGDFNATANDYATVYVLVDASDSNTNATLYYRFGTDTFSPIGMSKTAVTTTRYNFTYALLIPKSETRNIEYYILVNDTSSASVNYSLQSDTCIDTDGFTTAEKGNSQDLLPYNIINIAGKSELRYWDSQTTGNKTRFDIGEDVRSGNKNWNYVLNDIDNSYYLWANYTTDNKIAEDYVNVVKADAVDVWVGTRWGLSRFNRITGVWTKHNTWTTSKLPNNNINAIALDGDLVWVGTDNGPAVYNKITNAWDSWSAPPLPTTGAYTAVAVYGSEVWFGTAGEGLVIYNKVTHYWGKYKFVSSVDTSHDTQINYVRSIVVDNEYAWYGSKYGLIECLKQTMEKTRYDTEDIKGVEDDGGYLWLATSNGGYRFNKYTTNRVSVPTIASKSLCSVTIVNNSAWFGSVGELHRIYKTHNATIAPSDHQYSFYGSGGSLPTVLSLASAPNEDHLWVGNSSGLFRYNVKNNLWDTFTTAMAFGSYNIQSIAVSETDAWFAMDSGVYTYSFQSNPNNPSAWRKYTTTTTANGLSGNNIYAVALDGNDVWFGTWGNGISRYNRTTGKWIQYVATPSDSRANYITTIVVDNENVWFGTYSGGQSSGIRRYIKNTDTWINYTGSNCSIINNGVTSISPDGDNIWIGTSDKVAKFNLTNNSWTTYQKSDGLANNNVRSIAVDGDLVWFGTVDGVSKYNKNTKTWAQPYRTTEGLISNDVYAVVVDNNNIWFGTSAGVTRYSKDKDTFTNYTTSDGLVSNNVRSIVTKDDGTLWFGTTGGATRHDNGRPFTTNDGVYFNDANNNSLWDNGEDIWYDLDGDMAIIPNKPLKITILPYANKLPIIKKAEVASAPPHIKTSRTVYFNGTAIDDDGSISTYTWEFGDGNTSDNNTTGNTTHIYLMPGAYSVVFKVKDNDGGESQLTATVLVFGNAAPSVDIDLPSVITAKTPLHFYSDAPDTDGYIINYTWNFGDGNCLYDENPTHTYMGKGNFTINLTVTDNDNATVSVSKTISIFNQKPTIKSVSLPLAISIGASLPYNCTATDSDGEIVSYLWDFGDTTDSTLQNPYHTYQNKGNYNITLTVTDNDGESATTIIKNIMLENIAPMPKITEPPNNRSFNTSETINFNATASDPDGDYPLAFLWNFNDSLDPTTNNTSNTTTHAYHKAGPYTVTLTVTDSKNASNSTTINISITNRPPKPIIAVENITKDNKAVINSTLSFDASASSDEDGQITEYQWEIDGLNTSWSNESQYVYTVKVAKTYTVVLRVRDDNNDTGETRITIDVRPKAPIPKIDYDNITKHAPGEKIAFDASNSIPMGNPIISYRWDFGDGESTMWSLANIKQSHTYGHSGNYSVKLYVKDSSGTESNITMNVTMENIPPTPVLSTPHRSGKVGETITFDASESTDSYGKIVSYVWDFGDGTKETGDNPVVTHVYREPWQYKVNLTIIDDDGTSVSTILDPALMILSETSGGGEAGGKWELDDPNVIGLIVSGIGLAVGYIAYTAKKRKLGKSIKNVTTVYMRYRHKPEYCEGELNKIRENFSKEFEDGKLDGNNYLILEKKIDNYIKELRTKTVETKLGAIPIQIQQTIGNILADGRISREEYDGLMNTINSANMDDAQRRQLGEMFSVWMRSDDRFRHPDEYTAPQLQEGMDIPKAIPKLAPVAQRVRCTKCNATINVTSTKRPLTIFCPKCGMKGVLKGKDAQEQPKVQTITCPSCKTEIPEHLIIDGGCPYCGAPIGDNK